ncbi:MAG: UDP-N-acetylmuramoyl-L-alanyl-D-glutamate--2,6-diaminopimelate ligase [Desulfobacterales bacterium]|nr:UDP-N-acetylmuramoyl-L-alanyl-D-glutamate--2,6-diaminopimelate ligase [Desulfobacterales bacterium]
MKLSTLMAAVNADQGGNDQRQETQEVEITGIQYRSDRVRSGDLFVALPGQSRDGHDFAEDAAARGAAAVVARKSLNLNIPVLVVRDARNALAKAAARFYDHPSEKLTLIGITGTNGKTTTAMILEHMLRQSGLPTGMIGTINYHYRGKSFKSSLTTPEASDLQHMLADMAEAGVTHVIMEVSSHGVALQRIAGCRFSLGIFTNLSQDHLDFHGNMEAYWSAKKAFFTRYLREPGSAAVINTDDKKGRELVDILGQKRCIRIGLGNGSRVYPSGLSFDQHGIYGRLHLQSASFPFHSPLAGQFNLENILCAAAAAEFMGIAPRAICEAIETFAMVPGRLERISNTLDRYVFVDFSHTPAALKNVLLTLREIIPGRIICVFGCGGDRDRGKRPQMGEIAARYADLSVVTSDNPRTEAPGDIIADIVKGIHDARQLPPQEVGPEFERGSFTVEPDRKKAIRLGIRASHPGDAVLIAGKGHETYQIIGHQTVAFDDRLEAQHVLAWEMDDVADTLDH